MLSKLIEVLKNDKRSIVFTEGLDKRIQEAACRLQSEDLIKPILLGNVEEVRKSAHENGFDLKDMEIIDPLNYAKFDELVEKVYELRKGKWDKEKCVTSLKHANYFGTMLVKIGYADGLLGGATYSTADTVRPALQLIKTKPENSIVSSCFILYRETTKGVEKYCMGDCAINIDPTDDQLVEIAIESAKTAKAFGIDPKVAMLSYSTLGSGKGDSVDKVRSAADKAKAMDLDFAIDGELQFDAAFSETVAKVKCKDSKVAGHANTFIFPDINAGNIGYKIAQRLGNFKAYGPILQGLKAPINDLSRGCNAEEVYSMAIITVGLK